MRRKVIHKKRTQPDGRYGSLLISKLINKIMYDGKKTLSQKIVYGALEKLEKKTGKPALEALTQVFENAGPQLELKSRRIGGANYQVPYEVKGDRKMVMAIRWLIEGARGKKGMPMADRLATEFIDAFNNTGAAVKKKADSHKMAEANKAFAHFAW